MEIMKMNSGSLRTIGYDACAWMLQARLVDGCTPQYGGVGEDAQRCLSNSGVA